MRLAMRESRRVGEVSTALGRARTHPVDQSRIYSVVAQVPLLTSDVWEHAYCIDYRNERARYIDAFWSLVDWGFVDRASDGQ